MKKAAFSGDQEAILVRAIQAAEEGNRGEVRVHVEPRCPREDPLDRAAELFAELGMSGTAADTGVLLYVATDDHRCAVVAGQGVLGAEDEGFWQGVADAIANGYGRNDPLAGFEMALLRIGELLRRAAPGKDVRGNELPDRVTST
jgi:uncharacterized membrane protein